MYTVVLKSFPWSTAQPPVFSGDNGLLVIMGSGTEQDLTAQLPIGTQFYLVPHGSGTVESSGILRTITSASFDTTSMENRFEFTPRPNYNWTVIANLVVQVSNTLITPPKFFSRTFVLPTATPDITTLDLMVVPPTS